MALEPRGNNMEFLKSPVVPRFSGWENISNIPACRPRSGEWGANLSSCNAKRPNTVQVQ